MKKIKIIVKNETGLHSRPADLFVRTAKLYKSNIVVKKKDKTADAKNILRVILLNVSQNDEIIIMADGEDEELAIEDLRKLVESEFRDYNKKVEI